MRQRAALFTIPAWKFPNKYMVAQMLLGRDNNPQGSKTAQVISLVKTPPGVVAEKVIAPPRKNFSAIASRSAKWLLAFGVVAALGWYFGSNYILGPIIKTDVVKRQNVIQTVVASGQVISPFRINIGSQVSGVVRSIPVSEGQTVKKGELLIELDDTDAHEAVRLAQSVAAQWQAKLQQMSATTLPIAKENLAQAKATLDSAQVNFDRADKLSRQGAGTMQAADDARKALTMAQSQLRSATLQAAAATPSGSDYLAAQAQYDQAIASQHSAETKLGYYQILATRDGVLTTRNVEAGNIVQPGAVLMVLAPSGKTQIDMQIDEVNLGLLKLGQTATVSADAYPKQNFTGYVSYISPAVDPQSGSVDVKLDVANPPEYLLQSMTVSVEIQVARRDDVNVIANADVHYLSGSKPWVLAVENGRAQRRQVKLGTIGDDAVEIIDGVKAGDAILRGQAPGVSDGQRVRLENNG